MHILTLVGSAEEKASLDNIKEWTGVASSVNILDTPRTRPRPVCKIGDQPSLVKSAQSYPKSGLVL